MQKLQRRCCFPCARSCVHPGTTFPKTPLSVSTPPIQHLRGNLVILPLKGADRTPCATSVGAPQHKRPNLNVGFIWDCGEIALRKKRNDDVRNIAFRILQSVDYDIFHVILSENVETYLYILFFNSILSNSVRLILIPN